ncbi:HAMP domain-containing sensor histidine kinase [Telluribacter sp.]|uniref:sensor histidine kinase n=1 Tax=Telluribacter sp. TaxID=1978767 RepID=UPI002E0E6E86
MSRQEFIDLTPLLLEVYNQRLQEEEQSKDPVRISSEHGLHRWHYGFSLRTLFTEIKFLYACLANELDQFWKLYPDTSPEVIQRAYHLLIELLNENIEGSANRFDELERMEAASRAANLEIALQKLNELTRQRGDILRTSSHDLRGSMSVIQSTAFMLDMEGTTPDERKQLLEMMNRNLQNVQIMMQQLMNLARLEAGQESVEIQSFDASQVLNELIDGARTLANERNLVLMADGPTKLLVRTDPIKLRRIVQNLLLNAINYTPSGVVSVTWANENEARWTVAVQDSGPGLPKGLVSLLSHHLQPIEENTGVKGKIEIEDQDPIVYEPKALSVINEQAGSNYSSKSSGEGVGLYIVKRLCEILQASMDIESVPGKGTIFRIRFLMNQDNQ